MWTCGVLQLKSCWTPLRLTLVSYCSLLATSDTSTELSSPLGLQESILQWKFCTEWTRTVNNKEINTSSACIWVWKHCLGWFFSSEPYFSSTSWNLLFCPGSLARREMGAAFFPRAFCLGVLQVIPVLEIQGCMVQSIRTEGKTQCAFSSSRANKGPCFRRWHG